MRNAITIVVTLVLSILHSAPTAAALIQAEVFVNGAFGGGTAPVTVINTGTTPQSATASATGGANSLGSGTTNAELGAFLMNSMATGSINTGNVALINDTIMITAPGVATGTIGTVTYSIQVNGDFVVSPEQRAATSWRLNADIGGGTFDINADATLFNQNFITPGYQGDPFGIYTGTGTFQFGVAEPLTLQLRGVAQASYINASSGTRGVASIDQLSACWRGISNVSVGGNSVASYSISSVLGGNYAQASQAQFCGAPASVPEPISLALLGLGLAAMGMSRNKRHNRSDSKQ